MSLAGGIPMLGDWVPTYKNGIRVLYIDGEMALNEVRNERLNPMFATVPPSAQARIRQNLFYLSHEDFPECGIPDLATPAGQELVEQLAERLQAQVIIFDNKSCLFPSVPEIDGDPTAALNAWFLRLRRLGKSILLFHHGGKPDENGRSKQRGTSRIEDVMTATILLNRLTGMGTDEFALKFDKSRGFTPEAEFRVLIGKGGWLERYSPTEENAARVRTVRELAEHGVKGCEIAERLSISPSTVSRILKRKPEEGDAGEGVAKAVAGHSD
jgi:DNA-binding transcriptional ArsR family regulator